MGKRGGGWGEGWHDGVGRRRRTQTRRPVTTMTVTARDRENNNRPTMEAVGIGGQAREDAADNRGFGGQQRQGEGEEEAREAHCINGASRL